MSAKTQPWHTKAYITLSNAWAHIALNHEFLASGETLSNDLQDACKILIAAAKEVRNDLPAMLLELDPFIGVNGQGVIYAQTPCWSVLAMPVPDGEAL